MNQQWLEEFKVALVNEHFDKIESLLQQPLSFDKLDQIIEASALIQSALEITQKRQSETKQLLQTTKQQLSFLESNATKNRLDLNL